MKNIYIPFLVVFFFAFATSKEIKRNTPFTTVDPVCLSPPNGKFWCFNTQNPEFLHHTEDPSHLESIYRNDCHDLQGNTDGCILRGNELCVKASTDHLSDRTYFFSFIIVDTLYGNLYIENATITVPNTVSSSASSCKAPTVCLNSCPERQCEGEYRDLNNFDNGRPIGVIHITNKLNYELQIEVVTDEGDNPQRGWWMLELQILVGSKRIALEWNRTDAQSRWFEAIDLKSALPGKSCGDEIGIVLAALVTNDKDNENGNKYQAYPPYREKRSFAIPPGFERLFGITYTLCCECTIRTQTQNDFGHTCQVLPTPSRNVFEAYRIRELACYLNDYWPWSTNWCFPNGITVGCSSGFTVTYTNFLAVQLNSWPDETTARVLNQSWVNPSSGQIGSLAAEAAALTLNLRLDECDADWGSTCNYLGDYFVGRQPTPECEPWFDRFSISGILAEANAVLGGCRTGDAERLSICIGYINRAFVDGKRNWEAAEFIHN